MEDSGAIGNKKEWRYFPMSADEVRKRHQIGMRRFLSLTGFTLIEVLMVVMLVGIVSLAVYSQLSSGIRMMRRVTQPVSEENLVIFFEKLTRELQNSFLYTDIPFKGEKEEFGFATRISTKPELGGERGIGQVTYSYNSSSDSIERRQENINQIYKETLGDSSPLLKSISSLSFEYYGYEPSESAYRWNEEWDPAEKSGKSPLAVKIEFEFHDEDGKTHHLTRSFSIPVGE